MPNNSLIPHSVGRLFQWAICLTFLSGMSIATAHAMSLNMEEDTTALPYKPSEWYEHAVPEDDAALAVENNDLRLLAFALRTTNVPGVKPGQIQAYRKQCGLRYLKGFGDVARSTEDLGRMKLAREYALRYNTVITSNCSLSE